MNTTRVREALQTALMLSKLSTSSHSIEIFEIGEVMIQDGQVSILSDEGRWMSLTDQNVEERLDQLITACDETYLKDRLQEMVFAEPPPTKKKGWLKKVS